MKISPQPLEQIPLFILNHLHALYAPILVGIGGLWSSGLDVASQKMG